MKLITNLATRLAAVAVTSLLLAGNSWAQPQSTADNPHLAKRAETGDSAKKQETKLDVKDKDFISKAAAGGMREIGMGQMAEKQGKSDAVKNIGRTLVGDHTKANNELKDIAKKKGLELGKLANMPNFEGDDAFLAMMLSDHQQDVKMFEQEAKSGMDPDLKAFAAKTLPVLQKHLSMVKSARGKGKS
ncbi:MAG: DUF4142 domain-containing protein [Chthoniobacterales bacterium]